LAARPLPTFLPVPVPALASPAISPTRRARWRRWWWRPPTATPRMRPKLP
jgi:hypothetical protein